MTITLLYIIILMYASHHWRNKSECERTITEIKTFYKLDPKDLYKEGRKVSHSFFFLPLHKFRFKIFNLIPAQ